MHKSIRTLLCVSLLLTLPAALPAAPPAAAQPVADRLATQNTLFEELYQSDLRNSPERATAVGDYRYNDRLSDLSLPAITSQNASNHDLLTRLQAIPTTGFPDQDLLSHQLLERTLQQRIEAFELKNFEMSVNQQNGVHTSLADLPLSMPFDSVKHYEDYIARLHQIPRVLAQTADNLRLGIKDGLMPPRFLLEKVAGQANGVVASNPFLLPIKKIPATFSDADRQRLTGAIQQAVETEVFPAYRTFATFVATDYAPHGRTDISVASLPDGAHRYQVAVRTLTTTNLTPAQIHQLGLDEVTRITAEMTAIALKAGFKDLAAFRASINSNPQYTPKSEEQILGEYRHYIDQMRPKLSELFYTLPKAPVTVEAIPAFQAAAATHYNTGTPDGKRPGRVVVATSDFSHRTLLLDEAVAYHEGIPGHHMQLSIQQELTGLPQFRLHGSSSTAFVEGWALYAEQLGKEVGFYQDPVSDYGRLSSELFRAVRLVVDTGIHSQGWTRDQVVDYMRKNDVNEPLIQSETDRYIAWPGQACAYKIGQLKFRELRARAQRALGPSFDLRAFHDQMLNAGSLPLDLLDARTDRWIATQKSKKQASK
jgi:uncharacterized protein (DUF885 family)